MFKSKQSQINPKQSHLDACQNNTNLKELLNFLQGKQLIFEPFIDELEIADLKSKFARATHYATVILEQDYIDHSRPENDRFFYTEYQRHNSHVRQEAFRLMRARNKNGYEFVDEIINQYFGKDAMDSMEWYEEYENYMECLLQSFYPDAVDNLIYLWAFEKFSGKEEEFDEILFKLISEYRKEELVNYKKQIFMPIFEKKYFLKYNLILPSPLAEFNHSCWVKQFYLIHIDGNLHMAFGCSCGIDNRYQHGLYGHYFASLANERRKITSFITQIDKNCNFFITRISDNFIVQTQDLNSSYQISREKSDELLMGIEKYAPRAII